jgi:hypothetical protein
LGFLLKTWFLLLLLGRTNLSVLSSNTGNRNTNLPNHASTNRDFSIDSMYYHSEFFQDVFFSPRRKE